MNLPNNNQSSAAGYYCQNCGQWVPSGVFHYCNKDTYTILPTSITLIQAQEIIELLKRIASKIGA
jgi:hypothetical protein